jgi:hypothetical protein
MLRLDVVGVLKTVLVVRRPAGSSTHQDNAMLVPSHAIGFFERFAPVGSGIQVGFAAPRITFVIEVRLRCGSDHGSASG